MIGRTVGHAPCAAAWFVVLAVSDGFAVSAAKSRPHFARSPRGGGQSYGTNNMAIAPALTIPGGSRVSARPRHI